MAEKIEIEKPVVSSELAKKFETIKDYYDNDVSCVILARNYADDKIKEYRRLDDTNFINLLAKMFVVGYEIEKPKLKYIRLRSDKVDSESNYLNEYPAINRFTVESSLEDKITKTKFTQEEAEEFLKDEPAGMFFAEDVEDYTNEKK